MKRLHILVALAAVVFLAATALRVHSHRHRPRVTLRHPASTATRPVAIGTPRDYVAFPRVDPRETDRGPARIISLAPSITEIVCALGLGDRLVGRTPYCTYPPSVRAVPAVGAITDANFEKIRSLSPDLILVTTNSNRLMANLDRLHLHYEPVPHDTLEQVYEAIELVGRVCDRPHTARMLSDSLRSDIETLQADARASHRPGRRVLVTLGELPVPPKAVWVAGPGSFLDGLVRLAGHTNAAADALRVSHGEIPLTRMLVLDPEVILEFREKVTDPQMIDLYESWMAVGDLQAIREQRVRSVGGSEWLSAGPRLAIALHRFVTVLSELD